MTSGDVALGLAESGVVVTRFVTVTTIEKTPGTMVKATIPVHKEEEEDCLP